MKPFQVVQLTIQDHLEVQLRLTTNRLALSSFSVNNCLLQARFILATDHINIVEKRQCLKISYLSLYNLQPSFEWYAHGVLMRIKNEIVQITR